jgi:DNA-binding protein HU-beta
MNKADLVEFVATETESSKTQAEAAVNAVLSGIEKGLKKDKSVQIVGSFTLAVTKRPARTGRNPQTGAEIKIPAKNVVKFKAGSSLKAAVK